jgi:hypothetical protein
MCIMSRFWTECVLPNTLVWVNFDPVMRVAWHTRPWLGWEGQFNAVLMSRARLRSRSWTAAGRN